MREADAAASHMPPHRLYRDFLDSDMRASLLAWAIEIEAKFEPSTVSGGRLDRRKSLQVRDFGPIQTMLCQRVRELVPTLIRDLRVPQLELSKIVSELVAHNDGAFFKRHTDRFYGCKRGTHDRLLTAVYYFHAEPKAFSGGALRLYSFIAEHDENCFVDFSPEQNTLLAFPSVAPHEVLPVKCPSRHFSDSRFAVNFWVCQRV